MKNLQILSKMNHPKKDSKIKIMQFGEGNFLRAFVDWLIQKMNDLGKYDGHVVVVQPLAHGRVDKLVEQDGLYTVILQGINEEGKAVKTNQIIDVLDDFVNPYTQYDKYLRYATSKDLEVIVSNTTEAGIAFDENDIAVDFSKETPHSYPGKLLALLKCRYEALGRDYPLAIIPCELIDNNGDKLKEVLIRLAKAKNYSDDLVSYIADDCHYTSTLVDRIVPGFPKDEFSELCEEYGYIDNNMVKGEYFHLYVLKKEEFVEEKFPVDKIGQHAIYVSDVHPYKQRKVRILNGTHTTLVPVAYLCGFDEVRESLLDKNIYKFISDEQNEEIVPTVKTDDAKQFANDVIQRFLNPYVHHKLMSIALNSISKFKERDLPTILDNIKNGKTPKHMLFALASLIKFYDGYRINKDGEREIIPLKDNLEYIVEFKRVWVKYYRDYDLDSLVKTVLSTKEFWGRDLTEYDVIREEVKKYLKIILQAESQKEAILKVL